MHSVAENEKYGENGGDVKELVVVIGEGVGVDGFASKKKVGEFGGNYTSVRGKTKKKKEVGGGLKTMVSKRKAEKSRRL